MSQNFLKNRIVITGVVAVFVFVGLFIYFLRPASGDSAAPSVVFEIQHGESFRDVVHGLTAAHLIKSAFAFEVLSVADTGAFHLKPGLYRLSAAMPSSGILGALTSADAGAMSVTIPEGKNIYEIDALLAQGLVIHAGDLINYNQSLASGTAAQATLEGHLFPDTYQFARGSSIQEVVQKFLDNFQAKAAPLLGSSSSALVDTGKTTAQNTLIIASILEKEVPNQTDQQIVAGILQKRIAAKMPLDVDATVHYAQLTGNDAYNTYHHAGLPPGPIGNPGVQAIQAALHPRSSPYWYYLSDPKTGKTIYAVTLGDQNRNIVLYLK